MNSLIGQCVFFAILFNYVFLNNSNIITDLPNTDTSLNKNISFIKKLVDWFRLTKNNNSSNETNDTIREPILSSWGLRNDSHSNKTIPIVRRRKSDLEKQLDLLEKIKSQQKEPEHAGLYEPYWQSGEWVFLKTGTATTMSRTPTYIRHPDGVNWIYEEVTTYNPMAVYRECDRSCSYYFRVYGRVCGHRYDTMNWKNHFRDFNSVCDLELANCVNANSRPMWHPIHRGRCNFERFPTLPPQIEDIMKIKTWDPQQHTTTAMTRRKKTKMTLPKPK